MKRLLRAIIINTLAIWLTSKTVAGFSYAGGLKTLCLAALVLGTLNLFVRPFVKLFLLPINLLTLGFFAWAVNVLMLYLLTLILPQISISSFDFPGISYQGFVIPALKVNTFSAFVLSSVAISTVSTFLHWLAK